MSKHSFRRVWVLGVAALVPTTPVPVAPHPSVDSSQPKAGTARAIASQLRLESVYDSDRSYLSKMPNLVWGVDPFEKVPGYAVKAQEDPLPRLEAIFFRSTHPSAMLDGDEYQVGETIGNHRINEIGRNYVLLERGTSLIELVIAQGEEGLEQIDIHEHRGRSR